MNCDDAFDALTDPSRRRSPQLRQHLDACRRCRQMQLTLEPALHLFDTEPAEQSRSSAGDELSPSWPAADPLARRDLLSSETIRLAKQTAGRLTAEQSSTRSLLSSRWLRVTGYAAALLVGMGLALGAAMSGWLQEDGISSALLHDDNAGVSAPVLPAGCTRQEAAQFAGNDEDRPRDEAARRTVVLACVACHLNGAGAQ